LAWGGFIKTPLPTSIYIDNGIIMSFIRALFGLPWLVLLGGAGTALVLMLGRPKLRAGTYLRISVGWALALLAGLVFSFLLYLLSNFSSSFEREVTIHHFLAGLLSGALGTAWTIAILRKADPETQPIPLPEWLAGLLVIR
jgi:hypothetical protein